MHVCAAPLAEIVAHSFRKIPGGDLVAFLRAGARIVLAECGGRLGVDILEAGASFDPPSGRKPSSKVRFDSPASDAMLDLGLLVEIDALHSLAGDRRAPEVPPVAETRLLESEPHSEDAVADLGLQAKALAAAEAIVERDFRGNQVPAGEVRVSRADAELHAFLAHVERNAHAALFAAGLGDEID